MSLDDLQEQVQHVDAILEELQLLDDKAIQDEMNWVKISLEAAIFKLPETTTETSILLNKIHMTHLNDRLYSIIESALGYYALVDQPKGTNEPLIGPKFAQELIMNLKQDNFSLMTLKDDLHALIHK